MITKNITSPHLNRYFIINKPYNMVSQFVSSHDVCLLGDLKFEFPEGTHAIGRLDNHSEGLLILTTDKRVTRLLFNSKTTHKRSYLVMVQNKVSETALHKLREGVHIKVKEGIEHFAKPYAIERIENPKELYSFATDYRDGYPHSWLLITLTEGKFHQVRKMVLAIGHRCQRLIRLSIDDIRLGDLEPGKVKEMAETDFYNLMGQV